MWLLEQLSSGIGTDAAYIEKLARMANTHYRMTAIPKRTGGARTIWMPSPELKAVQRWLVRKLLRRLSVHRAAAAYELGSTIRENAHQHASSKYLLRMDFRRFFESVTRDDVCRFINNAGTVFSGQWRDDDTSLFADFVCWNSHLVIGAVTSPCLTNRMCFELDTSLAAASEARSVTYSRYADDLFFSTTTPGVLADIEQIVKGTVQTLRMPAALRLNEHKTQHSSKRKRRTVTGLVLACDGNVSLGRPRKRKIRAMVDQFDTLSPANQAWLRGTLAFCRDVEPAFVDRLILKYGAARIAQVCAASQS